MTIKATAYVSNETYPKYPQNTLMILMGKLYKENNNFYIIGNGNTKNILIKNITQENFDQYLDDFITLDALKISNDACEFKGFGVIQGNDEGILEKLGSVVERLMEIEVNPIKAN